MLRVAIPCMGLALLAVLLAPAGASTLVQYNGGAAVVVDDVLKEICNPRGPWRKRPAAGKCLREWGVSVAPNSVIQDFLANGNVVRGAGADPSWSTEPMLTVACADPNGGSMMADCAGSGRNNHVINAYASKHPMYVPFGSTVASGNNAAGHLDYAAIPQPLTTPAAFFAAGQVNPAGPLIPMPVPMGFPERHLYAWRPANAAAALCVHSSATRKAQPGMTPGECLDVWFGILMAPATKTTFETELVARANNVEGWYSLGSYHHIIKCTDTTASAIGDGKKAHQCKEQNVITASISRLAVPISVHVKPDADPEEPARNQLVEFEVPDNIEFVAI